MRASLTLCTVGDDSKVNGTSSTLDAAFLNAIVRAVRLFLKGTLSDCCPVVVLYTLPFFVSTVTDGLQGYNTHVI